MKWYGASLIVWIKKRNGKNEPCRFWENVVLIQAASDEEAHAKADVAGKLEENTDDSQTLGGEPAEIKYVGTRKLIDLSTLDGTDQPVDGAEVTYSDMLVANETALFDYASGKEVDVTVLE